MSEFKVKLNNNKQGLLDTDPSSPTNAQFTTSKQRTMFVAGPNRKIRELKDGETFTDCNYWKRFAVPMMSEDNAFIEILSDDGSIYSNTASDNVFPLVSNFTVAQGSAYGDNEVDFATDFGSHASFVQIQNLGSFPCMVKLNGSSAAKFSLDNGATQVFNGGDLIVTKLNFEGDAGGATDIQIIAAVASVCNS